MQSVTLYFTKRFTTGHLAGICYHDRISGPDAESLARRFRIGTKVRGRFGSPSYIVVDASFQNYAR